MIATAEVAHYPVSSNSGDHTKRDQEFVDQVAAIVLDCQERFYKRAQYA